MSIFNTITKKAFIFTALLALVISGVGAGLTTRASARNPGERVISIYDGSTVQTVFTNAPTIREVLKRTNITVNEFDAVEPGLDTQLLAPDYSINIYRARPVTVIDGGTRTTVMSPYQSPAQIAEGAGLQTHEEDKLEVDRIDNFAAEGVGLKLTIARSTPVNLLLDGKVYPARTHAKTIGDFLKEKNIILGGEIGVWPDPSTEIKEGMTIAVLKDGEQDIAEEEIPFTTERIQDKDQDLGYKSVKEAGVPGKRLVLYHMETVDGKEVRKELQSIVITQPKKQVEIVGTKTPGFNGNFADALARLRSCEGSYTTNTGNGYYGAYQYDIQTWGGYGGYPNAAAAPPEVQDQKAWETYKRRGWQPWPGCSRSLGLQDVYR